MVAFTLETQFGVSFFTCTCLSAQGVITHAFSTRLGGESGEPYRSLNLGFGGGDERTQVLRNRQRFAEAVGFDLDALVTLRQVHGNRAILLSEASDPKKVQGTEGDALLTNRVGLAMGVITADCLPVMLVVPSPPVLAMVHSGRGGTASRVVPATLTLLCERFGLQPSAVSAAIGPGIGGCCYEIDAASAEPFCLHDPIKNGVLRPSRPGHFYLDLQQAIILQLHAAGVPSRQIWAADLCTACHPAWFYSYRRDGPRSGRMLNVAMINPI